MRVTNTISDIGANFGVVLALGIAALVTVSVVARYIFSRPILYADEIAGYMFLAMVFFGLAYAFKRGSHIRVDLIFNLMSPQVKKLSQKISYFLALCWGIILSIGLWQLAMRYYSLNANSGTSLAVPLWIPVMAVFVGSVMMTLQVAVLLSLRREK